MNGAYFLDVHSNQRKEDRIFFLAVFVFQLTIIGNFSFFLFRPDLFNGIFFVRIK